MNENEKKGLENLMSSALGRRRFMKVTGATVATAIMAAACGPTDTPVPPTVGTGGPTNTAGGTAPTNTVGVPAATLEQWYHQYGEAGTQQAATKYAADYSAAHPGTTVNMTWVAGTYGDKLSAALLGSGAPDVFENYVPSADWVKAGLLAPLDDLFAATKSDWNPSDLSAFTVNGKIYGVKMIDDTQFIYYRKSLLKAANIDPTTLTTMDALVAAIKALSTPKVKGIYLGNDGGIGALQQILIWASGTELLSADNTKITFNTPLVASAYTKLRDLSNSGAVLVGAPTDWWDPTVFVQGLAVMQWCGLWAMPAIIKALGDDFGIMPWPGTDATAKPATVDGGWAEMVYGKGKNIDAAKAFVKAIWIDTPTVQQDWSLSYGFHVPPRLSTAASATKLQSGPAADGVKILNTYGHIVTPYFDGTMGTALNTAVSNIVKNNADATAELAKAAQACTDELAVLLKP